LEHGEAAFFFLVKSKWQVDFFLVNGNGGWLFAVGFLAGGFLR